MTIIDIRPRSTYGSPIRVLFLALIILGLGAVFPASAPAALPTFSTYNIVDLGLRPGATYSGGYAVNNSSQVAGISSALGFLYTPGQGMKVLDPLPGCINSFAYGLNNAGQVAGYCQASFSTHGFLYDGTTMIDIGTLPGGSSCQAYAVNNLGQVVGKSMVPPPSGSGYYPYHAFLYDGIIHDLGTTSTPGFDQTEAYAINDNGWVVGKTTPPGGGFGHAFIYANGVMTDIGADWETYGYYSEAHGVNNAGQVLITAISIHGGAGTAYAAIYQDGEVTVLGPLGNNNGRARGINSAGQVVGNLGTDRPFLADPQNGLVDLNLLIVGTNPFTQLHSAEAINDNGAIVGFGQMPDGSNHAYLAVPGPGKRMFGYVPYLLLLLD